jgi:cytochrome c-type biogenesis protein CcmH
VCQNQSIDDSDADLAHDLRLLVRQRLQAGDTDEQVRQYLVERYGDYILLNPPFKGSTYALWLLPPVFLIMGLGLGWMFVRQRSDASGLPISPLSKQEQARLDALLSLADDKERTR